MYRRILVVTDNSLLCNRFYALTQTLCWETLPPTFDYCCTVLSDFRKIAPEINPNIPLQMIDVKTEYLKIIANYDLVISAHCKQLFPKELVTQVKCINIHPGFNPYNRGWFPQVFSILNKLPLGATIHEIDEELDHGNIIAQEEVKLTSYDTSISAYNRVIETEMRLLEKHLQSIILKNNKSIKPISEGNINYKKDFNKLCALDMSKIMTLGEAIDLLRALSHGEYQ
ncbi:MAG: dTDP-4-amino-4,6-dideoxyglucose formyltransferase, partial [Thermoflexibacteraceae bacterium]